MAVAIPWATEEPPVTSSTARLLPGLRSGNRIADRLVSADSYRAERTSTPGRAVETEESMLYWALMFLIIAIIAGFLGFGGIAFAAAGIAKILFFIFLVVFVVMLLTGLMGRRTPPI
jgi:uncharacterized membrane protein YtjA (UPF0391 family)